VASEVQHGQRDQGIVVGEAGGHAGNEAVLVLIDSMRPLSDQFALLSNWFIPALVGQLERISNIAFRLPDLASTPDHDVWEPDTVTMSGGE